MSCSSLAAGQPHPGWRAALLCGGWNKGARLVAGAPAACHGKTSDKQEQALCCMSLLQSVGTYIKTSDGSAEI